MSVNEISLIAVDIRKWDLELQKITFNNFYLDSENEKMVTFDVSIMNTAEMVEEFVGKFKFTVQKQLQEAQADAEVQVELENEAFIRQKVHNYFKRILTELNNPRRKRGQPKMIYSTHMDVYSENQDISFLPKKVQFFVLLNWARKYYEKEDYAKAIDPLRKLIKIDPDFGLAYKWLARSLKKNRKYEEAMRYYEKYAQVDGSIDALLDLAKSYRKGKLFEKSEKIYHEILKLEPENKEARIGLAQIKYARKEPDYVEILDELYKEDPEWLVEWLVDEFNFRIYVPEKTYLSPVQASRFLGYNKVFELTQKAFKNDLPSHFNPAKARLSFFKEELENWANTMNRYHCLEEEVKLFPDVLEEEEFQPTSNQISYTTMDDQNEPVEVGANGKPLTRVEKILREIRERKAMRMGGYLADSRHGQTESAANAEVTRPGTDSAEAPAGSKSEKKESTRTTRKKKKTSDGSGTSAVAGRKGDENKGASSDDNKAASAAEASQEATNEKPRRRGRPPKNKKEEKPTGPEEDEPETKKVSPRIKMSS